MNPRGLLAALESRLAVRLRTRATQRLATRIARLTQDGERELLDRLLLAGVDQGWFLRPPAGLMIPADSETLEKIIRAASTRPGDVRDRVEDPYPTFDYPLVPIDGDGPGFIVGTQKCDLIQSIRREPFIELFRTSRSTDPGLIHSAKRNSARYALVAEGADGAWLCDLRVRAYLPKDIFFLIPPGGQSMTMAARRSLSIRLGNRYSRTAVPNDLVVTLQDPLLELLARADNVELAGNFTDWRILRRGAVVELIAIAGEGKNREASEDAFEELMARMPEPLRRQVDGEASRVVRIEELPFHLWRDSISLDLDEVSYGKRAQRDPNHAPPLNPR